MTFHAFLGILSAVITGLAIVKVLQGILWMIHGRSQIKVYWVHLVWVAVTIWGANLHFWMIVRQRNVIGDVNFYGIADILWIPIVHYILAGLLFPASGESHSGDDRPVDLQDFYYKNNAWFFGTMLVATLTNAGMLRNIITLNFVSEFFTFLVGALLLVALAVTRNKWYHTAMAIIAPLSLLLAILFNLRI
jgi:hypothetical protein